MNTYTPDKWVIFKVTTSEEECFMKVFATWAGGYLSGDSWRVNSGIEKVTSDREYYYLHGSSGSIYKCRKQGYGVCGGSNYPVVNNFESLEGMKLLGECDAKEWLGLVV